MSYHVDSKENKKFEQMLMRRTKAYSSSCSQTVSLSPAISLVLFLIGSMPMPISNHFHERLANNDKITTFTGVPHFDALMRSFP